jgi:hypothetical protein
MMGDCRRTQASAIGRTPHSCSLPSNDKSTLSLQFMDANDSSDQLFLPQAHTHFRLLGRCPQIADFV